MRLIRWAHLDRLIQVSPEYGERDRVNITVAFVMLIMIIIIVVSGHSQPVTANYLPGIFFHSSLQVGTLQAHLKVAVNQWGAS